MKPTTAILTILISCVISCNKIDSKNNEPPSNTIYRLGFQTDSTSTGPLENSAFTIKISDSLPALLLTAHHAVSLAKDGRFLRWDEIAKHFKNGRAWSMQSHSYNFGLGENLPIPNAETLELDLAAFFLPADSIPYLMPSDETVQVGDTVYLFSPVTYKERTTLKNRGVVIYLTDSVFVYELTDVNMTRVSVMGGTSGSCVLNKKNEVVSNSFAGFNIHNESVRRATISRFPLVGKFNTKDGKTYGVGVPIRLIEKSLVRAFKERKSQLGQW